MAIKFVCSLSVHKVVTVSPSAYNSSLKNLGNPTLLNCVMIFARAQIIIWDSTIHVDEHTLVVDNLVVRLLSIFI